MKTITISKNLYRFAKGFIVVFMLFSAYFLFSHPADLHQLGFPDYFRIELSIAKVIGAIALLLPITPARVKEWVYAGFIICMLSALIAHIVMSDATSKIIFVTVDTVLFMLSVRAVQLYERSQIFQELHRE